MDADFMKFTYALEDCPLKRVYLAHTGTLPWGFGPGEDVYFPLTRWPTLHRIMARHAWKQIRVLGETDGNALVFLAVPR